MRSLTFPIFLASVGSALEIYPVPQYVPLIRANPLMSDAQRIASDWRRVGNAMALAMSKAPSGEQKETKSAE